MDVWQYIYQEKIELPSLYYTHMRKCFFRAGRWWWENPEKRECGLHSRQK